MPVLSDEIKEFIVQSLACFRKPSLIIKDIQADFGVEATLAHIQTYNPEKGDKAKRLAKKWKLLFEETRKAIIDGKVTVGIAHQSYRLGLYQRAADYYEKMGNYVLAAEMAERAAKEMGGAYTNKRELYGKGGAPLIPNDIGDQILKVYGNQGGSEQQ